MKKAKSPIRVGQAVFVRTVTYHYTGRIIEISDGEIVLDQAAWIADSGRWANALATGQLNEIEPYPGVISIARGAVVDVSPWNHELPQAVR